MLQRPQAKCPFPRPSMRKRMCLSPCVKFAVRRYQVGDCGWRDGTVTTQGATHHRSAASKPRCQLAWQHR